MCATVKDSIRLWRRETSSRFFPQSQEAEYAGTCNSMYWDQEGTLRRGGVEDAAQLRAARAVRSRCGRVLGADRHARRAADLRIELQRFLRHEGPVLDR